MKTKSLESRFEKKCNHEGFWKPLGQSTKTHYKQEQQRGGVGYFNTPSYDKVVASIYCINCGEIKEANL